MKSQLNGNVLTLYFEGELNSYNADNIEREIEAILKQNQFQQLILDFANLRYISSAGLRIILKLKQKHPMTSVVEASLEVYDVLTMTGFTNIMEIHKALKRVYLSGAEVVGEGFFSTVYRIDKETIIKVFNRTSDANQIERELKLAKEAFVLGIPTAISFDIVRVDDKLGVRFEMLDCDSLKNTFIKYPEQYESLVRKYVELLKKINTTETVDDTLPDMKAFYFKKLDFIKEHFTKEENDKLLELVKSIPEAITFIHGDCHFKNIMVQRDELLLIDMDTLSRGNPIFELAAIYAPYVAFEEDDAGNTEKFLGVTASFAVKLFNDIVRGYFAGQNADLNDIFNKIKLLSYIHMVWWNRVNEPQNVKRFNGCKERLLKLLPLVDNLNVGL